MSSTFAREHCKLAVGKILQTIGWNSINSTPLEVLTDLMSDYIKQIAKITNDYANEFGQTEPNLDHLGLAFQEVGVNLGELEEYVTYVNFVPPGPSVPKFPIPNESHLNFLKPGSKEVVTRPVHINEHLPPMYPLLEEQQEQNTENSPVKKEVEDDDQQLKKGNDTVSPEYRRLKREEEGGRPTREISSVMMTTSGFLSPACEGKLPEPKAPNPPVEPPKPPSPVPQVPELVSIKKKVEKKKEKAPKDPSKSTGDEKPPPKKAHTPKEPKIKQPKSSNNANANIPPLGLIPPWNTAHFPGDSRIPPPLATPLHKPPSSSKTSIFNKTLAAAKAKTEKLNTTITPIPIKSEPGQFPVSSVPHHQVDKLVTEPDKKKINILKKISNVKEKHEKVPKQQQHHMSPHMIQQTRDIVNKISLSSDITIEPIMNTGGPVQRSPEKMDYFFDDGSPPGTPSTPRTPEIMTRSPPTMVKEKRKRKEKPEKPRAKKMRKNPPAHFMDPGFMDMSMEHHHKTSIESQNLLRPGLAFPGIPNQFRLPPLANFGGPGLIPHTFGTPLFPFSPLMQNFADQSFFSPPHIKSEPPAKVSPPKHPEQIKQEPAEVAPPVSTELSSSATPLTIKTEGETIPETQKKSKEHKKEKKEKIKKKNKKEKVKDKSEKKKLKEAKKEKDKKKKKIPKEEPVEAVTSIPKLLLKVNSPSPRPETPDTTKKLNIKPIIKKEEPSSPERKRETSPGLAKISALVTGPPKPKNPSPVLTATEKPSPTEPTTPTSTPRPPGRPRIHPLKPKATTPKVKKVQQQPYTSKDAEGNTIWFCPECDLQDDGRPMIGCDGCDAWYHWVCVGIQVPPDNNENWYCRRCLAQKNANLSSKKKKRKKKTPV